MIRNATPDIGNMPVRFMNANQCLERLMMIVDMIAYLEYKTIHYTTLNQHKRSLAKEEAEIVRHLADIVNEATLDATLDKARVYREKVLGNG